MKRATRWLSTRKAWQPQEQPKREWSAKARSKLRAVSERQRERNKDRMAAKAEAFRIWGRQCIYPGCHETTHLEGMHAYGKGAHPEHHSQVWNFYPGCGFHHRLAPLNFTTTPELKDSLMECADEMRASMDGKRPQPTWTELQDIITRAINKAEKRRRQ